MPTTRTGPAVDATLVGVPGAREFLDALTASTRCILVRGDAGSGKSLLLGAARHLLASTGSDVCVSLDDPGTGPLVLDGAHTFGDDALAALQRTVQGGERTVVVAVEARPHRGALADVVTALHTRGPVIDLRPLTAGEIATRAHGRGFALAPDRLGVLHDTTAGVLAAVDAGLDSLHVTPGADGATIRTAVTAYWHDALRHLDSDMLAALALCAFGFGVDTGDLAAVLDVPSEAARTVADRVRASVFVSRADTTSPALRPLIGAAIGVTRLRDLQVRLLTARLASSTLDEPTALTLVGTGLEDPRLARFLCDCADSAGSDSAGTDSAAPGRTSRLLDAAVRAGAGADTLALRRAEASLLDGDLDAAEALADGLLVRTDTLTAGELVSAVRVSATVAALRGAVVRSADLYEWLGPDRVGGDSAIAATVLLAAGRPESAAAVSSTGHTGPPTSGTAGAALLADGVARSVEGHGGLAMNSLSRAMSLLGSGAHTRILPDTATAVTALLCLHSGELAHANSVLRRALDAHPDAGFPRIRHLLLSAWTAMVGGDPAAAAATLASLPDGRPLSGRDALFAHGLRVGLARRSGDIGALQSAWAAAQPVVAGYSADLFSLLPLGELWLAAVRLDDEQRIAHLVEQAQHLLARLGEPPLWGSSLHWYGVQAAILGENPARLLPHARALAAAAEVGSYSAGLAAAGRVWLRLLREEADASEVEAAARTLDRIGLPWDGARLAGEAALRVPDTKGATTLLQVARSLRDTAAASSPTTDPAATDTGGSTLTDREADVAGLLLLGLTHREIGARLYIAPKTVEHHVARIRRRLGARSRSELMSMLRALGHGESRPGDSRRGPASSPIVGG
ncbi:LuxR C-terminal-related transcriptional regulator [Prescottella subtropica]|uniref:LuxR C-terminal-related transcriptional regulator n=1 Tax=Prescottella subtropica TaxID=2545757 RepID=UPI0010F76769|nr:LuxR C-terminal-related transcriptional regulator [Prescottella subtropica]